MRKETASLFNVFPLSCSPVQLISFVLVEMKEKGFGSRLCVIGETLLTQCLLFFDVSRNGGPATFMERVMRLPTKIANVKIKK